MGEAHQPLTETDIFNTLVLPYVEMVQDINTIKLELNPEIEHEPACTLDMESFFTATCQLGCMLSRFDLSFVGRYYSKPTESFPSLSSPANHTQSWANTSKGVTGIDKGYEQDYYHVPSPIKSADADAKNNSRFFDSWLQKRGLANSMSDIPTRDRTTGGHASKSAESDNTDAFLEIHVIPFVNRLSEILYAMIARPEEPDVPNRNTTVGGYFSESKGEKGSGSSLTTIQWAAKDFDIIDSILMQLEKMDISNRRRCLLTFEGLLRLADGNQNGDVDGFAILSALLHSKFSLPKLQRTRLLQAVEDQLGGRIHYRDFCQVFNLCCPFLLLSPLHLCMFLLDFNAKLRQLVDGGETARCQNFEDDWYDCAGSP